MPIKANQKTLIKLKLPLGDLILGVAKKLNCRAVSALVAGLRGRGSGQFDAFMKHLFTIKIVF